MAAASSFPLLLCFFCIFGIAAASQSSFIVQSCRATRYPIICVRSLLSHSSAIQRNPQQIASAALAVSLQTAQSAEVFISKLAKLPGLKPQERAAARDCVELLADSKDRLSKSIEEMKIAGRVKGSELSWRMSNVQTWVSTALTDYNTCMDGFSGRALDGRPKRSVQAWMLNTVRVTSNALALCNRHY